ncbi:MAG: PAS domain-containing protein [Alphaproteobacteria bacterium]
MALFSYRSLAVNGRYYSIRLSDRVWDALHAIAREEQLSVAEICSAIDMERDGRDLGPALFDFVEQYGWGGSRSAQVRAVDYRPGANDRWARSWVDVDVAHRLCASIDDMLAMVNDSRAHMLVGLWNEIRGDRPLPHRNDLDLSHTRTLRPFVFVVDVEPDTGRMRYRDAGSEVMAMYPVSLAGRCIDEFYDPVERGAHFVRARDIFRYPAAIYGAGSGFALSGLAGPAERIALPLTGDAGTPSSAIGLVLPADRGAGQVQPKPDGGVAWHLSPLEG